MKEIKSLIKNHYQLEVLEAEIIPAGNTTTKYLVTTEGNRYLLRIRDTGFSRNELSADHAFLSFLAQKQLPVPRLISTRSGNSFLEKHGRIYELQSYLDHDSNLDQVHIPSFSNQLFSLLGRFHRASFRFPHRISKPAYLGRSLLPVQPLEKYFLGPLQHGIPRNLAAAENLQPSNRAAFLRDVEYFKTYLQKLETVFREKFILGPILINHNDFFGNNILLKGEKIVGLVDFDFCLSSLYIVDLIEALHGSMVWQNDQARFLGMSEKGQLRLDLGKKNLKIYFDHNPDFPIDGPFLIQFLIAKVISLPFYPAFDFWKTGQEKLEGFRRLKNLISHLEGIHSLEI